MSREGGTRRACDARVIVMKTRPASRHTPARQRQWHPITPITEEVMWRKRRRCIETEYNFIVTQGVRLPSGLQVEQDKRKSPTHAEMQKDLAFVLPQP